jgi:Tfp pilus assembly protein PilF
MAASFETSPQRALPLCWALIFLTGLAPALPFQAEPPAEHETPDPQDKGKLERLLSRARQEAALAESRARRKVTDLLSSTLSNNPAVRSSLFWEQVARLVDVGPPGIPALIDALSPPMIRFPPLEPGLDEAAVARRKTQVREQAILRASSQSLSTYRADVAAHALNKLASPAATDDLVQLIQNGTGTARIHALLALESCPEPERAAPALIALLDTTSKPAVQRALLICLVRIGGKTAMARVRHSLDPSDPTQATIALSALAAAEVAEVAPELLTILQGSKGGAAMTGVLAYYRTFPELLEDNNHLTALLAILVERRATRRQVTSALELLLELRIKPRARSRTLADELAESRSSGVSELALKWLASTGNKRALRILLKPLDKNIQEMPTYGAFHTRRANLLYEVGEYKQALEGYGKAILMSYTGRSDDAHLGAARCHARLGKFKSAANSLRNSSLKRSELSDLPNDPAFKEMARKEQYWVETFYRKIEELPE